MDKEKKNKHMQLEERIEIQECLCKGMTFKAIARRIGKDPTTVSKEVKLHATDYENGFTKTKDTCPKLLKAPFVCNGCEKQNHANCLQLRSVSGDTPSARCLDKRSIVFFLRIGSCKRSAMSESKQLSEAKIPQIMSALNFCTSREQCREIFLKTPKFLFSFGMFLWYTCS